MRPLFGVALALWLVGCSNSAPPPAPEPVPEPQVGPSPQALSAPARLRKLSLHLRGVLPSVAEFAALRTAVSAGSEEAFFEATTKEYLKSPRHVGKMVARLDELFRLRSSSILPEARYLSADEPGADAKDQSEFNSLDRMFEQLVRENQNWDTLATGRDYRVAPSSAMDTGFYKLVGGPWPDLGSAEFSGVEYPLTFGANDPRVAGAVTTGRFFNRYGTTALNRNRGRAAAVFRVFLCDDMRAVITPTPGEEEELLENAFPTPPPDFHKRLSRQARDEHGTNPACMNCHYKLDPLGESFMNIGSVLYPEPAPGRLTYRRADGSLVDLPGRGLGDLLQFVTLQPEYLRCQVSHFWKWFIRGDELPSPARWNELVAEFEAVGRRPNDFIAYLVRQPEFLLAPQSVTAAATLAQVGGLLHRCDRCHEGLNYGIPRFGEFPIGGNAQSHIRYARRIADRLDLAHGGEGRTMPPPESAWQPSDGEITLLQRWFQEGLKGIDGVPTVDPSDAAVWLEGTTVPAVAAPREFRDSYVRYLRSHDLIRMLRQQFPRVEDDIECLRLGDANRALAGDANPVDGTLAMATPSLGFVRWFGNCLLRLADVELKGALKEKAGLAGYLGASAAGVDPAVLADPEGTPWASLPEATRQELGRHLVGRLLPHLTDEESQTQVSGLQKFLNRQGPSLTVFKALQQGLFFLGSGDGFLSF